MRYVVQTQAPAGNWVDSIITEDKDQAIKYAKETHKHQKKRVRVVLRADRQIRIFE